MGEGKATRGREGFDRNIDQAQMASSWPDVRYPPLVRIGGNWAKPWAHLPAVKRAGGRGVCWGKWFLTPFLSKSCMRKPVVAIAGDRPIIEAVRLMKEQATRHVAVTQDGQIIGVISVSNILRYYSGVV